MNDLQLSENDRYLVETQFPAALEKEAQAEANKISELYEVGFSKIASGTVEAIEKGAQEGGNGEEEEEEEEEEEGKAKGGKKKKAPTEEMDEGEKKEAAARGAFIARGFIDGLMKQGSDATGDPLYYVYDLMAEKVAHDQEMSKEAKGRVMEFLRKLKGAAGKGGEKAKEYAGKGKEYAKSVGQKLDQRLSKGQAAGAAGAAGLGAGAGMGAMFSGRKKDKK